MCSEGTLRQAVHRGTLDMDDLVSVIVFIAKRNPNFLTAVRNRV